MVEYQEYNDHQLMHQVTLEDKGALEAIYARYGSSVYSLAMYMLKQEALAEEATQDIFLNIWLKASSYKTDRGEPRAWIMSVAHHKIVATDPDGYETLELLPSAQISTEEEVERKIERERILKAVATLPPPQRQVIMMAYFEGYTQSEMAKILKQPLGTVKTRVRLAMQKLRLVLEGDVND